MQHLEISQCGTAGRPPSTEAAFHRRERIRRILAGRDKVQGRAHQRRLYDLPAVDSTRELIALKARKTRPERDIRGRRPLTLKAAQTLDRVDDIDFLAFQQELPRQERAIQLTNGERGNA